MYFFNSNMLLINYRTTLYSHKSCINRIKKIYYTINVIFNNEFSNDTLVSCSSLYLLKMHAIIDPPTNLESTGLNAVNKFNSNPSHIKNNLSCGCNEMMMASVGRGKPINQFLVPAVPELPITQTTPFTLPAIVSWGDSREFNV